MTFYDGLNLFSVFSFECSNSKICRTAVFLFTWWLCDTMDHLKNLSYICCHMTFPANLVLSRSTWCHLALFLPLCLCFLFSFISLWGLNEPWQVRQSLTVLDFLYFFIFLYISYISNLPNKLHQFSLPSRESTVPMYNIWNFN